MPDDEMLGAMDAHEDDRLSDDELRVLFGRLFPYGVAGSDVIAEIAPHGWEQSPLLACFHPSVERLFEERLRMHRNAEVLRGLGRRHAGVTPEAEEEIVPEPTLEDTRREYAPTPVEAIEEVTDLVGQCLWDVFSDNHDVVMADGRVADIGSFRGAAAFLDGYLTGSSADVWEGDSMRFYMGTAWISTRADLAPVYTLIFRRLKRLGADWVYRFPELHLVELAPVSSDDPAGTGSSVSERATAELAAQRQRAEIARTRARLAEINDRAREEAMDAPPPPTVRAYRGVYGRDPRGWPPA